VLEVHEYDPDGGPRVVVVRGSSEDGNRKGRKIGKRRLSGRLRDRGVSDFRGHAKDCRRVEGAEG
jgi:hypothetical protein